MLVTMQNSELIQKLVLLANGDIDLVQQAIRVVAGTDKTGAADLTKVVDYIARHRREQAKVA
jgi:hypothetical protein